MSNMNLSNNSSGTTLQSFFLVTTNSGEDIGVVAGATLKPGQTTNSAWFNVDSGDTDTFMVFFVDQDNVFWQSNGMVANLDSGKSWSVNVSVSGDPGQLQMGLTADAGGGEQQTFGPWPLSQIGCVDMVPMGSPPANANCMGLWNLPGSTEFAVYYLVATNSGEDIGVLAGSRLPAGGASAGYAGFNVDRRDTNTFMLFFVDHGGTFWQSNGIVANLPSGDATVVGMNVFNQGGLQMAIQSPVWSAKQGPIFKVGTVYTPGG